jgi:hypothetical protein
MKPKLVSRREMLEITKTLVSFGLWEIVSPFLLDVYQVQSRQSIDPFQDLEDELKTNENLGTASIAAATASAVNLTMAVAAVNQTVSQNTVQLENHSINYFVFFGSGGAVPLPIGPAQAAETFFLLGHDDKGLYTGTVLANGGEFHAGPLSIGNYYGMENISYNSPLFGLGSTPQGISMLDISAGSNVRLAGFEVGGGVFETQEESGNYFYIRGETAGVHLDLGVGFSGIPFLYLVKFDKYRW